MSFQFLGKMETSEKWLHDMGTLDSNVKDSHAEAQNYRHSICWLCLWPQDPAVGVVGESMMLPSTKGETSVISSHHR